MSLTDSVKDLGRRIAAAVGSVKDDIAHQRAKIADTARRLHDAKTALPPKSELAKVHVPDFVAKRGAQWRAEHGGGLGLVTAVGAINPKDRSLPQWCFQPMTFAAWLQFMSAAAPKHTAELLAAIIHGAGFPEGAASAERPALVEQLTRELRELEDAEEAAIDDAIAAGVTIAHRPDVVQRREREREERRRREELAREPRPQPGPPMYPAAPPNAPIISGYIGSKSTRSGF